MIQDKDDETDKENCSTCYFYRADMSNVRVCRRFPVITKTGWWDWCGEFKQALLQAGHVR